MSMGPRHEAMRTQYVQELREAIADVRTWWEDLVNETVSATGSRVAAAAVLERRWTVGPSAHPRILAVIHKYYIACEDLNLRLRKEWRRGPEAQEPHKFTLESASATPTGEPDAPVPPGVFVGESLVSADTQDLATIIGYLRYWPVGVDSTGQFV